MSNMSVQVASDDTIWFVEQYANYIFTEVDKIGMLQP